MDIPECNRHSAQCPCFKARFSLVVPDGKAMILAYDQGMEHGPRDFDEELQNYTPANIIDIGIVGKFTAIVLLPGDAEKYYSGDLDIPLILKVNSKSELYEGDNPYSPLLFSGAKDAVDMARELDAVALGYTVYLGSKYEHLMTKEFGSLVYEAHRQGFPVVAWMYPRGEWTNLRNRFKQWIATKKTAHKKVNTDGFMAKVSGSPTITRAVKEMIALDCAMDETPVIVAYAASAGARLGADIVKIKYCPSPDGSEKAFRWAVLNAGKTRVVMSGGPKAETPQDFYRQVRNVMRAGGAGVAVGRNVWQDSSSVTIAHRVRQLIFHPEKKLFTLDY